MCRSLLLLLPLSLAGCLIIGPRATAFPPATGPAGVTATLTTSEGVLVGEVVETSDSALLVLREDRRLVLVPYAAIRHAEFDQIRIPIQRGLPPEGPERERLRLVSRYPRGVSAELLRALLAAYEQRELEVIRP